MYSRVNTLLTHKNNSGAGEVDDDKERLYLSRNLSELLGPKMNNLFSDAMAGIKRKEGQISVLGLAFYAYLMMNWSFYWCKN